MNKIFGATHHCMNTAVRLYSDNMLIYRMPILLKVLCFFGVFHYLCVSPSLICWPVWRCLAGFINSLIIDSYFWFAVAVGVSIGLKLDSHKVSVMLHSFYSFLPLPSLKIRKPWVNIAILCPFLDELNLSYLGIRTLSINVSLNFDAAVLYSFEFTRNAVMEEYVAAENPPLCWQLGHLPHWPCF